MVHVDDRSEVVWDSVADIVVVGGGAAGMSAAVTAAAAGSHVLVLERAEQLGGTTAKSEGALWIPDNPLQAERGWADSHADAVAYVARLAYPQRYNPLQVNLGLESNDFQLIETFCRRAGEAITALRDMNALHIRTRHPDGTPVIPSPDYQSDLPEHTGIAGRSIGPMWPAEDEIPRGFRGPDVTGGLIMIETMRRAATARSAEVRTNRRVVDVVIDDTDRVIGVVVHVGRHTELIGARKGVIFGSGGFLMNLQRRQSFLRGPVFGGCAVETNEGDLVEIGSRLGVEFGNMSHAWWDQTVVEVALRTRSTDEDIWMPFGDSMIQVNKYGLRVVNEKQTYNERGQIHLEWNPSKREYSNRLLFQIWDEAVASNTTRTRFRGYVPYPDEEADYVLRADTLDGLADAIEARLDRLSAGTGGFRLGESFRVNLPQTIARFNRMADTGVDEDFARGQTPLQQAWQAPCRPNVVNPCLAPFAENGPYYAMILAAGALDTKGGPQINPHSQIVRADGEPITGLYGAGNCISSPMGQAYPGAGGTIGPAIVFGFIAGKHAAASAGINLGIDGSGK